MKKYTLILLAAAMAVLPSCKNQNKTQSETQPDLSTAEKIAKEALVVDMQNLVQSAKGMKPVPFAQAQKDGRFSLTEKEKMVKPDYLLNPAVVDELVTLSQKYRAGAMLAVDLMVANLYDMPSNDLKEALGKLLVDVNDSAFSIFAQTPWSDAEALKAALSDLVDAEYADGRPNFFWESAAASLIEQVYVLTRDIDKFMCVFTDESAAEVTYNFVCVHEGIRSVVASYPEMASLDEALAPLYVINAISVSQLKDQLLSLKNEIEKIRAGLLS